MASYERSNKPILTRLHARRAHSLRTPAERDDDVRPPRRFHFSPLLPSSRRFVSKRFCSLLIPHVLCVFLPSLASLSSLIIVCYTMVLYPHCRLGVLGNA